MLSTPRTIKRAAAVLCAAALAGCAFEPTGYRTANLNNTVPVTQAFIVPPPGGPEVLAVLENRYANALAQDIILENNSSAPGQNVIYVRAFGPLGRDRGVEALDDVPPTLEVIRRELRERFPGVHMEVSGLYAQNRYGPFSYATGRTRRGAHCIYTWQRIAAERRVFAAQRGSINWRLRLCDDKTSARDLLLLAYNFTITGYFMSRSWNPYGDAPAPDPRIGEPGEVVLPQQTVDPTVITPNSFNAARAETIRRPSRSAAPSQPQPTRFATPTVLNDPTPGAAVVPRPENTDLSEPFIEGSNLPRTSGRAVPSFSVPAPPRASGLRVPQASVAPSVRAPAAGTSFAVPPSPRPTTVRIVGTNQS